MDRISRPMVDRTDNHLQLERLRLRDVYRQRSEAIDPNLYAPWQPGEMLMLFERRRLASDMLVRRGKFPGRNSLCLEIGYGKLGWLGDLITWGVKEESLFGIELDQDRGSVAMENLPAANLMIGDATSTPWEDGKFDLVILSTVLSSISSDSVWDALSAEVERVLSPSGAVLIYDVAVRNPRNKNLRPVTSATLKSLFPGYRTTSRSLTLAPPVARFVARRSWTLASILSALPFARTHRLTMLTRRPTLVNLES